ncbi:MAG: DUF1592 domain-containing protein [Pirellulales bacterium]|nr:DUF1592 domain-containing protein [Pirellulales bacterium]
MPGTRPLIAVASLLALGLRSAPADSAEAAVDPFASQVRPILQAKCLSCHAGDEAEGGLDLSKYHDGAAALAAPEDWERVLQRVNLVEMPPEGSPGLTDVERVALVGWIQAHRKPEDDCARLAGDATQGFYPGHVLSRRLSRDEYNNTIRDLVGLDLRPADDFPADGSGGEGFDNVGDTLYVSTVQVEHYLTAAKKVLDAALPSDGGRDAFATGGLTTPTDSPVAKESRPLLSPVAKESRPLPANPILIAQPGGSLPPREAARQVVAQFARRAFRRPVSAEEVERLLTMFDRGYQRGDGFVPAVKLALQAVLISPHFLFLVEQTPETEGVYRLSHYELAARLAYFIWASMPDEQLLALARDQRLYDASVLKAQVQRMLADPKAHGLAASFAVQWLGIGPLGETVRPDAVRFPEFDAELAALMRAEAVGLFETVLREDRSLLELVDCDYAILNDRLAAHYGLPPLAGSELRKTPLEDRRRGGVLGLGAVLTTTSYPLRTSPVLRGKWILEELFGATVPPPPPDAGTLPEDDRNTAGLSLREQLEAHRKRPECAACHQRMDPLGFGLECFDAVGRWRHHWAGEPIDASGQLPSGQSFSGPVELKQVLLARKDEFVRHLSRKMLGYALGRGLSQFDDCIVDDTMEALQASDYRSSALIETIVLSYPFQHRYAKP